MYRSLRHIAIIGLVILLPALSSWAATEGSISGTVFDNQDVAVSNAKVRLLSRSGSVLRETTASATGDFQFFPVILGDYSVSVDVTGFAPYQAAVHVASGSNSAVDVHLEPKTVGKEMVLEVKAKRRLIHGSTSVSSTEINQEQIAQLPAGNEISLPRLLTTTTPGSIAGPFGQMFFRGNHANIQYQVDGVQLPDSPSNTFGQAFSPRNIDHMEVITGGIPAEYGERLAAVVNIVTKSGAETPGGEAAVNYGSYSTFSPHVLYGGSTPAGTLHYFLSGNYMQTNRGLDTPQPVAEGNLTQGGTDSIHNHAYGNNELAKIDWLLSNDDKLSLVLFNAQNHYDIPNYPSTFQARDAFFSSSFVDPKFGAGPFNFVPSNTNDFQNEANSYAQLVWRHTFSEKMFLQVAPYYKYSAIRFQNDPSNDLYTSASGPVPLGGTTSSFYENRHVNNGGVKADFTNRIDDRNLFKTGMQIQGSRSDGLISVQTNLTSAPQYDSSPDVGYFESYYAQDDITFSKSLTLNLGVRFDATQFAFSGLSPTDWMVQPRIGLNYMLSDTTKLHVFYGRLFQPAPVENLRDTFVNTGAGQLAPYDIKAEKDDYFEIGAAQQLGAGHAALVNVYYKSATNMLDDAQLLNSSIAQPYNFATGYAYGIEFSIKGQLGDDWSDYANYSFEIAKGQGISGGIFAFPAGTTFPPGYQFLDHVQEHTANAGLTYSHNHFWWTSQALFGSGLRTGPNNTLSLPDHFTLDTTLGYEFHGDCWYTRFKLSGDALNLFNNVYPITIANGFNGSHYAAGREFFVRLSKEL